MPKVIDKIQLLHPEGKNAPAISRATYNLFEKAIREYLKKESPVYYTALANGVRQHFSKNKIDFAGSVNWYTVSVKNHLESTGVIETFLEKGRKMHRLKIA